MKTIVYRAAGLSLMGLLVLLGSGASAWALPGEEKEPGKPQKIERHRIVIVGPDGKEKVIEGPGPMVRRGYLGVGLTELTPQLRTHFGAPEDAGVMVSNVEKGSPADKAGIEVGDILSRLDGKDIESSWDVRAQIRDFEEGQQVPLEVWRDRKVQTLTANITLRERPEMDMGPLFIRSGDGEGGPALLRLREMEGLPDRIEMPLLHPEGGDGQPTMHWVPRERSPRERELEQKLQELEKRIADLEKQLSKKGR